MIPFSNLTLVSFRVSCCRFQPDSPGFRTQTNDNLWTIIEIVFFQGEFYDMLLSTTLHLLDPEFVVSYISKMLVLNQSNIKQFLNYKYCEKLCGNFYNSLIKVHLIMKSDTLHYLSLLHHLLDLLKFYRLSQVLLVLLKSSLKYFKKCNLFESVE